MPFNRRGHDSVSTYDSREAVGGAYQTVAEGIEDNDWQQNILPIKDIKNPVVIGHSNGGVLGQRACRAPPRNSALILLPPMPAETA